MENSTSDKFEVFITKKSTSRAGYFCVSTQLLQSGLVGKLFLKVLIHRIYLLAFFAIHRAI
jgi:hypothetical protein